MLELRTFFLLLVIGIAFSCSSESESGPKPEWRSGSRLRAVVVGDGTAKQFLRFHDIVLDADCEFQRREDGALHCVPTVTAVERFGDANCTQPYYRRSAACDTALPGAFALAGGCDLPRLFERGAPVTTDVYEKTGTSCFASGQQKAYLAKRALVAGDFVKGIEVDEPRGSQLSMRYVEGEDGSRAPFAIEDAAPHAGECRPVEVGGGELRCIATQSTFATYFSDASCTQSVALAVRAGGQWECPPSKPVVATRLLGCGKAPTLDVFTVGALTKGRYYSVFSSKGGPATCSLLPATVDYVPVGEKLPLTSFAKLTVAPSAETPLSTFRYEVEGGAQVGSASLWDAVHGVPCAARVAADGVLRCIPGDEVSEQFYLDAQCTRAAVYQRAASCDPQYVRRVDFSPPCDPPGRNHVFKVVGKVTQSVHYAKGGGGPCEVVPGLEETDLEIEPESDAQSFPRVYETTE